MKQIKRRISSNVIRNIAATTLGNTLTKKRSDKSWQRSNKSRSKFLMPSHTLNNFEMQKCYQNEPKSNGFVQEIIYQK